MGSRTYSQMHRTEKYSQRISIICLIWWNSWVFVYELSGSGLESSCSHLKFRFQVCFEKGVPWHSGNWRVWIHFKKSTWHENKIESNATGRNSYSQLSSITWSVWPNGWVFLLELSGCRFDSSCSYLNFRFCACFEEWVPWYSHNYTVWFQSEKHTWHNKNIQSNPP